MCIRDSAVGGMILPETNFQNVKVENGISQGDGSKEVAEMCIRDSIDSSASLMSLAGTSVYSASKAALKSLSESLREELRGKCYVGICLLYTSRCV